jgi:hypothetical protein
MKDVGHRLPPAAAVLLIVASTGLAGYYHRDHNNRDQAQNADRAILWHAHANGCAPGNDPPPGTNCSQ